MTGAKKWTCWCLKSVQLGLSLEMPRVTWSSHRLFPHLHHAEEVSKTHILSEVPEYLVLSYQWLAKSELMQLHSEQKNRKWRTLNSSILNLTKLILRLFSMLTSHIRDIHIKAILLLQNSHRISNTFFFKLLTFSLNT